MSCGYPGGVQDLYSGIRRVASYQENPLSVGLQVPAMEQEVCGQIQRGEFLGKRKYMEFRQNQEAMEFYLRNVRMRPGYHHASPFLRTEFSPELSNPRYGFPILRQQRPQYLPVFNNDSIGSGRVLEESEKSLMSHRLQELERKLLEDEDESEAVSVVTEREWSDAIRDLIGPVHKNISQSPSSSSSSSCTSTCVSQPPLCFKQALVDAAVAISEGKPESGNEILNRLVQEVKGKSNSDTKLVGYMASALKSRADSATGRILPVTAAEVCSEERSELEHMLYRVSPSFMLGFMAANLAILEATSELSLKKIHVLDFELGQGGQYIHLIHTLAANAKLENEFSAFLTITAFPYAGAAKMSLKIVGDELQALALRLGVSFRFQIRDSDQLSRDKLEIHADEALAVNFAYKLHKLPDESVTVENPRDELLRRVKTLSPAVVTIVEQDLNANTAPLITRVRDAYDYYAAVLDSLDSTVPADHPERKKIDNGVRLKLTNSIACDGRDRVERCELHGKWRARLGMAGFHPIVVSSRAAEMLRAKLNSRARVNPGFTVTVDAGGIYFGWRGKTLAFASAWR